MQSLQQHINKIAELFFRCGGNTVVICPGSRNVPLILAFVRHKNIRCIPVTDERSAGFIALGIAQQTRMPVAIICTSGTATVNFYAAICEAFYQSIPLVVITADRPPELIDQWDGQAIRQNGIYKNHVLAQITFPHILDENSMRHISDDMTEMMKLAVQQHGPVHINVPLQEPFYPASDEIYKYDEKKINIERGPLLELHRKANDVFDLEGVINQIQEASFLKSNHKLLVIIGMNHFSEEVFQAIQEAQHNIGFPVIADVISNYRIGSSILAYDFILDEGDELSKFKADVLITVGGAVLSKNLKKFIRRCPPGKHFHIQANGIVGNPFQSLTSTVRLEPELFFNALARVEIKASEYSQIWNTADATKLVKKEITILPFCELKAAHIIFESLPQHSNVQLSNSMPVRYGLSARLHASIKLNSNRGTSGIDGCSSTAIGAAFAVNKITTLITGDIAFFYDVNAYWNKLSVPNLRIIVFNNGGGGIFRLLDGPSELPELETYIENSHSRTAKYIVDEYNFEYLKASTEVELLLALSTFFDRSDKPKLLEVFTSNQENAKWYKVFRKKMNSPILR